jgi:hypothetical protein
MAIHRPASVSDTAHIVIGRPSILANPYLVVREANRIGNCWLIPWYKWTLLGVRLTRLAAAPRGEDLSVARGAPYAPTSGEIVPVVWL